jgi:RES domain-containing protein
MALWRISNYCDLTGVGAETVSARWHTAATGKRIVYLAEHPALALVEMLVNLRRDPKRVPALFQLLKVAVPEGISAENVDRAYVGKSWEAEQRGTQVIGDDWLAKGESALLRIPAAPAPESWNYLLNPLHSDAREIQIEWRRWIAYDERLLGFRERADPARADS